jgi:hypothetical protein
VRGRGRAWVVAALSLAMSVSGPAYAQPPAYDGGPLPSAAEAEPQSTETAAPRVPAADVHLRGRGRFDIVVSEINDSKLLGIWVAAFPNRDGDDFGWTHGLQLDLGYTLPKGPPLRLSLSGRTDLYTRRTRKLPLVEGQSRRTEQLFTSENLLVLRVDNRASNKLGRFAAEVGWHRLDSQSPGSIFQAGGQQQLLHALVTAVDDGAAISPVYRPDGFGVRDGLHLAAEVGVGGRWAVSPAWALGGSAMLGPRLRTLPGASQLALSVAGQVAWQAPHAVRAPWAMWLDVDALLLIHDLGVERRVRAALTSGIPAFSVGFSIVAPGGDLANHTRYNLRSRRTRQNGTPRTTESLTEIIVRFGFPVGGHRDQGHRAVSPRRDRGERPRSVPAALRLSPG